jgi:hypothetical protein
MLPLGFGSVSVPGFSRGAAKGTQTIFPKDFKRVSLTHHGNKTAIFAKLKGNQHSYFDKKIFQDPSSSTWTGSGFQ